jgi:glyoxylate utilization-related uncharacterized protein
LLCRFIFVLDGLAVATVGAASEQLHADDFAYFPADAPHSITSEKGAGLLVFERRYAIPGGQAEFRFGSTRAQPLLPAAGEVSEDCPAALPHAL